MRRSSGGRRTCLRLRSTRGTCTACTMTPGDWEGAHSIMHACRGAAELHASHGGALFVQLQPAARRAGPQLAVDRIPGHRPRCPLSDTLSLDREGFVLL